MVKKQGAFCAKKYGLYAFFSFSKLIPENLLNAIFTTGFFV